MPGLLETTAHIVTATVGGSAKACIDAADDPSPVVRARSWSIGIIAVGEHGRWQHASLEGAVLEVAQLGCADRRGASDQNEFVRSEERRVGKECVSQCRSRWSPTN